MSGTFAYLLLLVHLFSVGLTASLDQEGLAPPQLLVEEAVETVTLTSFTWSYISEASNLLICAEQQLLPDEQKDSDEITLSVTKTEDSTTITDYDSGIKTNNTCVSFTVDGNNPLEKTETTYQLHIHLTGALNKDIYKQGSASFAMTVETSTFTCNSTIYRRVSGETDDDEMVQSICSPNTGKTDQNTCYIEGNEDPFCFNVEATLDASDGFQICLGNTNQYTETSPGSVEIDNLLYASDYGTAAFSLSKLPNSPTIFEAIFLSTDPPIQYCTITDGECEISPYSHGTTKYDICTIAILDDPSTAETTLLSITDLNANAYVDDNGLLQFRFVNLNPACLYSATIVDTAANAEETDLPTVNIDCSHVAQGHTCYGFLEALDVVDENKFLDIKYLDDIETPTETTPSNTIRVPHPALPTTATPTQTPLQKS